MVTGQPFRIERIRADRDKPDLIHQHLTAALAAARICGAEMTGAAISSQELTFRPGAVKPGEYAFSLGSAGSTMLIPQAILPALFTADGPSLITLDGGPHNPHAAPFDFLEEAFQPLMPQGPEVHVVIERAGFYPAGGGRASIHVNPVRALTSFDPVERGPVTRTFARAIVAGLPGLAGRLELGKLGQLLGLSSDQLQMRQLPPRTGTRKRSGRRDQKRACRRGRHRIQHARGLRRSRCRDRSA